MTVADIALLVGVYVGAFGIGWSLGAFFLWFRKISESAI
jgi:hypothetical protein